MAKRKKARVSSMTTTHFAHTQVVLFSRSRFPALQLRLAYFMPVCASSRLSSHVLTTYLLLIGSVVLLWTPRSVMRRGQRPLQVMPRRSSSSSENEDESAIRERGNLLRLRMELARPRNWVDLLRALAGAGSLSYAVKALNEAEAGPGAAITARWLTVFAGVLAIGVMSQMVRREGGMRLFAPVFFLQGIVMVVADWRAGLLSTLGIWALSPIVGQPVGFLFVQALCLAVFSVLFTPGVIIPGIMAVSLLILPVFTALLLHRNLTANFEKRGKVVVRTRHRSNEEEEPDASD